MADLDPDTRAPSLPVPPAEAALRCIDGLAIDAGAKIALVERITAALASAAEPTEAEAKMVAKLLCCGSVMPLTLAGECVRPGDCYAILERSNTNRTSRFSQMDMARKVCAALLAGRQP